MGAVMAASLMTAPAQAAPTAAERAETAGQEGAAQQCREVLGIPYKASRTRVSAPARTDFCAGWHIYVELQRSRWSGWQTMDSRSWRGDALHTLTTTCSGTHNYRLRMTKRPPSGATQVRTGREVRLSCPG